MVTSASPALNHGDYQRIAAAIEYMRQQQQTQPSLADIAQHIHLSEYHFQRLFSRWAGISPKRFLQALTVESAKARMAQSPNLLSLSLDSGLSSSARLHDLFINLEAMSPAEYRDGGRGLSIRYGIHETPFGLALMATTPKGVCNLEFLDDPDPAQAAARLRDIWPQAQLILDAAATQGVCDRLLQPLATPSPQPLSLLVKGTNFQIQVWRALLKLPFGGLSTYQTLANDIGRPTASRAVGSAIGKNAIAYLIPCHRVIRTDGHLGGYRWGLTRKSTLLGWEASRSILDETATRS
ncbi:MAG: methylated-DNA--[protein]-cysteine S-methyltransferase [Cyanobacteria bacterium]|nr:methylated-DNA--[protein]-cysteine S-methyltransferase [Cyanobacteriota bacterium]